MANNVSVEIITPSKSFYRGECELLIVRTTEGEEGFMAGHAWACKLLEIGELWIREPGSKKFKSAAVAGGFIDVKDSITIFTDAAEWREDIDKERAEAALAEAKHWLENDKKQKPGEVARAEKALKRAEVRLKVLEGTQRDSKG